MLRYKDISPYDSTRVVLAECPTGDYINANHVRMEVAGSGIVNRYIATQVLTIQSNMSDLLLAGTRMEGYESQLWAAIIKI
jgi:protein tyrosine phosphatase